MIEYWHNPRCSKSRTGLALLDGKGAEVEVRKYLENAPTANEIRKVLTLLGLSAIEMMRTREKQFKELGLTKSSPEDTLIAAMAEYPILIERPIAITNGKAAIGRPPEILLDML